MNIVLLEPEIPFNTGAIGRTCVATGTSLHLIRPYGFILNDKNLRRAGMDYWDKLSLYEYNSFDEFLEKHPEIGFSEDSKNLETGGSRLWLATTKAKQVYSDVQFSRNDYILFGKESAGIPEEILSPHPKSCIRLPMRSEIRSLNLSNSVTAILYESLRQNDFFGMEKEGDLHRLEWQD